MSSQDKKYQRRKSSTDAMKQQREAHMSKDKEQRRKSTVAKLWNWLGTKKEDEPKKEDRASKPKHRAAKKTQRAHTVAVVERHDYSDASSDSEHGEVFPAPPPLRRQQSTQGASVPLTPPRTPEHRSVGDILEEDEITPSSSKALEAARADYDDTSQIEQKLTNLEASPQKNHSKPKSKSGGGGARPKQPQEQHKSSGNDKGRGRRKKKRTAAASSDIDVSVPLEWPATPETILNYHEQKPILTQNEEWLIVELHEFECLLESMDMVRKIAKFSKFFELDPPELLEEFFEFVEEVPAYDEVINIDIWQEFRDVKYPY